MTVVKVLRVNIGILTGRYKPFSQDIPRHDAKCITLGLPADHPLMKMAEHRQIEVALGNLHCGELIFRLWQ
jgi:hypothetical protein